MITKAEAKQTLSLTTDADLARVFGIGRWAVGQWKDGEPIPKLRELQLQLWFPDKFKQAA